MMDGMLSQKVTPLLKCVVLFMFIFTAKVLTTRPHDSQDARNSIHHQKASHYVRTFTKYHHRRTIQWNNLDPSYWTLTQDQPRAIAKRSVEQVGSELLSTSDDLNQIASVSVRDNVIVQVDKLMSAKDQQISNNSKKYKVKAAAVITDAPTTLGPTISCLYKMHTVGLSVTPSYDDGNAQFTVENEIFDRGDLSETTLPNGEVVQIEKCTDPKAFCYTLRHQDSDDNITVLGQGCWRSSQGGRACDKCTRVTTQLPRTRFCCCTRSLCNADTTSLKEEAVTMKAESTMASGAGRSYSSVVASGVLAAVAVLLLALLLRKMYCRAARRDKGDLSDGLDVEKGEVMGRGPESLATGPLCVDNITLIEHIGQGKFGSVWRGSLGARPVAVKLYSSTAAWQKEAAVYAIPHLAHPNILRYYGSDSRSSLVEAGRRSQLVVLELCSESLRDRLVRAPLAWLEFATLAHGLAAALAHLHTPSSSKPCIVHRDVNSGNVLISMEGRARLADLGLAQALPVTPDRTCRLTEAGTLRYLSPEALEGALDLSGARAALCAVDVFALGLVLWEMLWRCRGAQPEVPPYTPPYHHHGLPARPTLAQMQSLVSRGKARPPLPPACGAARGRARALRLAADTCDECWDHDAEARLTAVCVEERMSELKTLLSCTPAADHEDRGSTEPSLMDNDKNTNSSVTQNGDVTTPLLYPDPHVGRNMCIERNTNTHTHTVETHKTNMQQRNIEDGLAMTLEQATTGPRARENTDRMNEIRSYQRPLDYVQNDVSAHDDRHKRTNTTDKQEKEKTRWGLRKMFEKKCKKETEVNVNKNGASGKIETTLVDNTTKDACGRPSELELEAGRGTFEGGALSPPNKTLSDTMMRESVMTDRRFRELPASGGERGQVFAVIVPRVARAEPGACGVHSRASIELRYMEGQGDSDDEQLMLLAEQGGAVTMTSVLREARGQPAGDAANRGHKYTNLDNEHSDPHDKENVGCNDNPVYRAAFNGDALAGDASNKTAKTLCIKRQHSLEQVRDIFSSGDATLLNPAGRVKTPGDLPAAVRRARARERGAAGGETLARGASRNRLSLYDDRMMFGNTL